MIVLDASVLIAHLDGNDRHHGRATVLLAAAEHETLGASPISLAEVLVGPARVGVLDRATAALDLLGVATVPLPADAPTRLASLRAGTGLKLPDCCVLLAAETSRAAVASFDDRLTGVASRLGFAVQTSP